jgi:transposase
MQYALMQVLPDIPPGGVCAGIDWASKDHVACVVDIAGRVTDRFSAAHDKAGIAAMITRLRRAGPARSRSSAVTGCWSPRCWPRA